MHRVVLFLIFLMPVSVFGETQSSWNVKNGGGHVYIATSKLSVFGKYPFDGVVQRVRNKKWPKVVHVIKPGTAFIVRSSRASNDHFYGKGFLTYRAWFISYLDGGRLASGWISKGGNNFLFEYEGAFTAHILKKEPWKKPIDYVKLTETQKLKTPFRKSNSQWQRGNVDINPGNFARYIDGDMRGYVYDLLGWKDQNGVQQYTWIWKKYTIPLDASGKEKAKPRMNAGLLARAKRQYGIEYYLAEKVEGSTTLNGRNHKIYFTPTTGGGYEYSGSWVNKTIASQNERGGFFKMGGVIDRHTDRFVFFGIGGEKLFADFPKSAFVPEHTVTGYTNNKKNHNTLLFFVWLLSIVLFLIYLIGTKEGQKHASNLFMVLVDRRGMASVFGVFLIAAFFHAYFFSDILSTPIQVTQPSISGLFFIAGMLILTTGVLISLSYALLVWFGTFLESLKHTEFARTGSTASEERTNNQRIIDSINRHGDTPNFVQSYFEKTRLEKLTEVLKAKTDSISATIEAAEEKQRHISRHGGKK